MSGGDTSQTLNFSFYRMGFDFPFFIFFARRQAPIGDNNYLLLATRSPFDPTVTLRNYDSWKIGSTSSMPAMMPTRSCTSFRSARPGADGESNVYTILKYDYSPACGQCDTSANVQLTTGSTVEDSSSSGKRLYEKKDIVHQGKKPSFPERVCTS